MNYSDLQSKFQKATRWNSALFIVSKVNKTLLSIFLFSSLSKNAYVAWANIYSIVYLAILWLNFGFEKSVPQYALKFAQNYRSKKHFIKIVIAFKLAISLIVNGAAMFFIPKLSIFFGIEHHRELLYLGGALFFVENIKTVVRFLFHSYFWNKAYNIIESIFSISATIASFVLVYKGTTFSDFSLIKTVLFIDIAASLCICLAALALSPLLTSDRDYTGNQNIDEKSVFRSFTKHSLAMWGTTILVSLTERNILVPFITVSLGPSAAGIFKVANDAALLFQRFVLKTIGTSGTSLLSHVEYNYVTKNNGLAKAASMLSSKIHNLIFPLISILFFCLIRLYFKGSLPIEAIQKLTPNIAQKEFFILALLYLYQILFSPQERILEVKKNYADLYVSFMPHLVLLAFYLKTLKHPTQTHFSLVMIIMIAHCARLASLTMRSISVYVRYKITFPFKRVLLCSSLSLLVAFATNILFYLFGY